MGKKYLKKKKDLKTFSEHQIKADANLLKVYTVGILNVSFQKTQSTFRKRKLGTDVYKSCKRPINTRARF